MPLQPGTRLGPYEITAAIGAGGMGEVYEARDTRLDRTVAIKVLPAELASDPGRRERLEREAKAIAALNHPHICTLHDVGHEDGTDFLVLERLEGESLQDRLRKGPLPHDEALAVATGVADALDRAHRHGITHRDLKPGNIFLTKRGAKLLDFGLAKLREPTPTADQSTQLVDALTDEGTLLGTLPYMAPEQIEGGEADARTDIWAFGCALFEMLTGQRTFSGKSQASLIGAILKDEPPPVSTVQAQASPTFDRIIQTCLAKDPDERFQTGHELLLMLRWTAEGGSAATGMPAATGWSTSQRITAAVVAVLALVVGGVVGQQWFSSGGAAQNTPKRLTLTLSPVDRLAELDTVISPDGRQLVFVGGREGSHRLFHRALDRLESVELPGTDAAARPFFSPDGNWVGFFADGYLKKVSLSGDAPIVLCECGGNGILGGDWGPHGTIVLGRASGLRVVPDTGGAPVPVTESSSGLRHRDPEFLPDGQAVIFTVDGVPDQPSRIEIVDLSTEERRVLVEGHDASYVPSGHLLFLSNDSLIGTMFAAPFDARSGVMDVGAAQPVLDDVYFGSAAPAEYSVGDDGTLIYLPSRTPGAFVWVTRTGDVSPASAEVGRYRHPALSPDGTKVVVTDTTRTSRDLWVLDLTRGGRTRITNEALTGYPAWTADGTRITYNAQAGWGLHERSGIYTIAADGSGQPTFVTTGRPMAWSSTGVLAYHWDSAVWVVPPDGDPRRAALSPEFSRGGVFSPNGEWLAYVSRETDRDEVYVQPYPGPGPRWSVSTDGGSAPLWSSDGTEIFYRRGDKVMAVPVETTPTFSPGSPDELFGGNYSLPTTGGNPVYGVAPDGRFLMLEDTFNEVIAVVNWFEELRELVPVR